MSAVSGELVDNMYDRGDLDLPEPNTPSETVVTRGGDLIHSRHQVISFRNRPMILVQHPYPHFQPLHRETFERIAYPLLGGVSRSRINDVFHYMANVAPDLTANERYILFGQTETDDHGNVTGTPAIWDMKTLQIVDSVLPTECVWRSPYSMKRPDYVGRQRLKWVLDLAGGSEDIYDDIMQSLAPLIMDKKPDGVVWWVGDGANGKSTLMDAIYKIFPSQLASITVKRLSDGRDTPSLNGTLGNVVKESSEGRIEDTEIYKAVGTHENFRVHKFHSQDDIEIRGNLHHIFSANQIPSFNDKGFSARRRTYIVPFTQRFASDPTFEERIFTPDMFGHLISEMCYYAQQIAEQGYRYKWSAVTLAAKADYDAEASNAEEYTKHLISEGIVGFDSYAPVRGDYENWCLENGYVPLGIGHLRRALTACGFERQSYREGREGRTVHRYLLPDAKLEEVVAYGMSRPGMYTLDGFKPTKVNVPVFDAEQPTEVPVGNQEKLDAEEKITKQKEIVDIIGDKW